MMCRVCTGTPRTYEEDRDLTNPWMKRTSDLEIQWPKTVNGGGDSRNVMFRRERTGCGDALESRSFGVGIAGYEEILVRVGEQ